jgi:hypothetical protein
LFAPVLLCLGQLSADLFDQGREIGLCLGKLTQERQQPSSPRTDQILPGTVGVLVSLHDFRIAVQLCLDSGHGTASAREQPRHPATSGLPRVRRHSRDHRRGAGKSQGFHHLLSFLRIRHWTFPNRLTTTSTLNLTAQPGRLNSFKECLCRSNIELRGLGWGYAAR